MPCLENMEFACPHIHACSTDHPCALLAAGGEKAGNENVVVDGHAEANAFSVDGLFYIIAQTRAQYLVV